MELTVHFNAEQDSDRLFEKDEDAVAYLENIIEMIQADSAIFDGLYKNKYFREYGEPIGPIDLEVKPILSLWEKDIKVLRVRSDSEEVAGYRIIYAPCHEKQPNGAYIRRIDILAVVNKKTDKFDYQAEHPITKRIIKDYEELYSN